MEIRHQYNPIKNRYRYDGYQGLYEIKTNR